MYAPGHVLAAPGVVVTLTVYASLYTPMPIKVMLLILPCKDPLRLIGVLSVEFNGDDRKKKNGPPQSDTNVVLEYDALKVGASVIFLVITMNTRVVVGYARR